MDNSYRCDEDSIKRFFGTDGWHDFEDVIRERLHASLTKMTNMPMDTVIPTSEAFRNLQGAQGELSAILTTIKDNMMNGVHLGKDISLETEEEGGEENV